MKSSTVFLVAALAGSLAWAIVERQRVEQLRDNNRLLLKEITELKNGQKDITSQTGRRDAEMERLRAESLELRRLRAEVTALKQAAAQVEALKAQNQKLSSLAAQASQQPSAASQPPLPPAMTETPAKRFTRDQWNFAGYSSPEASLISAIWAMREGKPQTYLDSLTPEEQARMALQWEGKDETEVATKHQTDTAKITGINVLSTQSTGKDEVTMTVAIEGTDRTEKVRVRLIDKNWKVGPFIR